MRLVGRYVEVRSASLPPSILTQHLEVEWTGAPRLPDTATVNHSQWAVQGSGTISTSWVQGCGALGALWIKCPEGRARLEAKYRALRMTTCSCCSTLGRGAALLGSYSAEAP